MRYITLRAPYLDAPRPGAPHVDLRLELQAVTTAGYAALRIAEEMDWAESDHLALFLLAKGEWLRLADDISLGEVADQHGEDLIVTAGSVLPEETPL
jgi:hypothetical protein